MGQMKEKVELRCASGENGVPSAMTCGTQKMLR